MTVGLSTTVRNNRLTQILNAIDLGAGPGLIRIYDGSRPATGGTVTTKLAELTCADPSGSVAAGVLHGGGKLRRGYPRQHQHLERLR